MSPRVLTALPVYNEETHLVEVLGEVARYAADILVVDDGSSDRTAEVLAGVSGISVLTHEQNQGYGAALRSAFCYAIRNDFDVVVTIDCDGQHEPSLIPEIAAAVYPENDEPWDIVSGSRYLKKFDEDSAPPEERRRINMMVNEFLNTELDLGLTDSFCGFKAYRTLPLERLSITELGYAMPLQMWVQVAKLDFRICEFPVPLIYLDEERSFGGAMDDSKARLTYYRDVINRELDAFEKSSYTANRSLCD